MRGLHMNSPRQHANKQVLVLRSDTGMGAGKIGAQASHASLGAFLPRETTQLTPLADGRFKLDAVISAEAAEWFSNLSIKIVAHVDSEAELHAIHQQAQSAGLPCALIQDAGFTHFDGIPTYTAVGIGPAPGDMIDKITRRLPLLR